MTMANCLKSLVILCLINLTACSDKIDLYIDPASTKNYPNVDERLWPYFQRFEMAAAEFGRSIDLKEAEVKGYITAIGDGSSVGLCNYSLHHPGEIKIDRRYWEGVSNLRRELMTFHELGHCFLQRAHLDEAGMDGICKSIMRSGRGECLDYYTEETRAELLKELFEGE